MRIIAPLIKLGLGGGAVYFLVDQKLFSDNQKETIEASKKFVNLVSSIPGAEPYFQKVPKLSSKDDLIAYWNAGVKISINFIANLPTFTKDGCSEGFIYLKEQLQKQMKSPGK